MEGDDANPAQYAKSDLVADGPVYLSSKEAARYMRLSPSTLSDWRVQKIGPRYYKMGPARKAPVLYHREDLDIWLTSFMVFTDQYARRGK
ncbi:MAG: helix-turn-helix domain-containing protein [Proteobacteria bacterium]|nr:helix-turn-helix domain-containing protein [Pseudomonadota bacterium]